MILAFGNGQLGQELAERGKSVAVPMLVLPRAAADITDRDAVANAIEQVQPDVVVNAAAFTAVDQAEERPDLARLANVDGAANVASACAGAGVPLIHISTDYVFDGANGGGAYREDDVTHPLGVYGRTKREGELAVAEIAPRHLIVRTSWLYGCYGRNFLKTILRLAGERERLAIVADQHGCPTSTEDLAAAVMRAAAAMAEGEVPWGTYHFAGRGATTWHGFASAIVAERNRLMGGRTIVDAIGAADYPTPARRPANSILNSGKFTRAFGFTSRHWPVAVSATVAALIGHEAEARKPAAA